MARVLKHWLDLSHAHAIRQVLFVSEEQQGNSGEVVVLDHPIKDALGLVRPLPVVRVNDIDQGMALLVVLEGERGNCMTVTCWDSLLL